MHIDPTGAAWWHWVIGAAVIAVAVAAVVLTGGAAIAVAGLVGAGIGATTGAVFGGMVYDEEGNLSWDWDEASKGFAWGAGTGFVAGAAGAALSSVGTGLGIVAKLGIQAGINGTISGGLTAIQGVIQNSFSLSDVGLSFGFGAVSGAIGATKWGGQLARSIGIGFGLGVAQGSVGELYQRHNSQVIDAIML